MQILLNNRSEIIAFVIIGSIEGAVKIDDTKIPSDFESAFKPLYFVYKNGAVIKNEEFEEIEEEIGDDKLPPMERIEQLENLVLQLLKGGDEL